MKINNNIVLNMLRTKEINSFHTHTHMRTHTHTHPHITHHSKKAYTLDYEHSKKVYTLDYEVCFKWFLLYFFYLFHTAKVIIVRYYCYSKSAEEYV